MAAIQLYCPFCGQKLTIEPEALRSRTACPRCEKGFVPIEAIPKDQTLPIIALGAVEKAPEKPSSPLAGQVKTILMPPNGGPLPVVHAATQPAEATPSPAPLPPPPAPPSPQPGPLPPLTPPPVLDGPTLVKVPLSALESPAPLPPPDDALAATVPVDRSASEPEPPRVDATVNEPPAVDATVPAPPPVDPPAVDATVNDPPAIEPAAPEAAATAPSPAPTGPAPAFGVILSEIAAHASARGGRTLAFEHMAIVCAFAAILSFVLLGVTNATALRVIGGIFGAISLAAALLCGAAFVLARSRKDDSPPTALSHHARLAMLGGALSALLLGTAITVGIAAATAGPASAPQAQHWPPPKLPPKPELPPEQRADYKLKREGHFFVNGGLLHVPPKFRSDDGAFDLYIHFHGNTKLVEDSVAAAGVNALVYTVNAGNGSGPYEDKYAVAGVLDRTIDKIEEQAKAHGLKDAKARRVALGSWSAGYGALAKLLDVAKNVERIDAVLVLDGIHAAYVDKKAKTVDPLRLSPFLRFARLAAEDKRLFTITHSDIQGASYASTSETADALLRDVGAERTEASATPPRVTFPTAVAALAKSAETQLEQKTEARKGGLHVRGFSGQTPDQHMAHLVQMSVTVLPELAERWR